MIEFKKNVKELLPYDREQYIESFDDDFDSSIKWYGVSFQLPGGSERKEIGLTKFVEVYEGLFKSVVLKLNNGSFWIVNHDDKDSNWLPNDDDNLTHLRTLFKEKNAPNTFKGALVFTTDDLLEYSKDLISYPYAVLHKDGFLYKDLNVSHGELQFIIKISGHLNIDLLSTDQELLRKVVHENSSNTFIVKEYRCTSLY
ncbi:hypothetical protein [Pedobacter sp. L105]|uniref:hypothetical protein n=1 Tax=Pedobacter sp. L105 TaxID=1641871 RepID=UPI00131B944B|nr:hypothetical protein [Pedobacter sp. L105]